MSDAHLLLVQAIKEKGRVLPGGVLNVASFLNHAVIPDLAEAMANEFVAQFGKYGITKILTLETSGIPVALLTARTLGVTMIYAKKGSSAALPIAECYVQSVFSYTKKLLNEIYVARSLISDNDKVLLIDDFLAHGSALTGLARIVEMAGATTVGAGIIIEKSFQNGREAVRKAGFDFPIHSIAQLNDQLHIQM